MEHANYDIFYDQALGESFLSELDRLALVDQAYGDRKATCRWCSTSLLFRRHIQHRDGLLRRTLFYTLFVTSTTGEQRLFLLSNIKSACCVSQLKTVFVTTKLINFQDIIQLSCIVHNFIQSRFCLILIHNLCSKLTGKYWDMVNNSLCTISMCIQPFCDQCNEQDRFSIPRVLYLLNISNKPFGKFFFNLSTICHV